MTSHSPLPWKAGMEDYDGEAWLWIEDAEQVAVCGTSDPDITDGSQNRADTDYIVQAVNAYDGLVAAQRRLRDLVFDLLIYAAHSETTCTSVTHRWTNAPCNCGFEAVKMAAKAEIDAEEDNAAITEPAPDPPNALLLSTLKLARSALTATMHAGGDYDWNADPRYITRMHGEAVRAIDTALALGGARTEPPTTKHLLALLGSCRAAYATALTARDTPDIVEIRSALGDGIDTAMRQGYGVGARAGETTT